MTFALRERNGESHDPRDRPAADPEGLRRHAKATITLKATTAGKRKLRSGRSRKVALYAGTTFWAPTTITVR